MTVMEKPQRLAGQLYASWVGPIASGVPMGASRGIGYVLGAAFDIPHGHTSCIMLPAVMRWNKPVNAERQALVAAAIGHPGEDTGEVLDCNSSNLIRQSLLVSETEPGAGRGSHPRWDRDPPSGETEISE